MCAATLCVPVALLFSPSYLACCSDSLFLLPQGLEKSGRSLFIYYVLIPDMYTVKYGQIYPSFPSPNLSCLLSSQLHHPVLPFYFRQNKNNSQSLIRAAHMCILWGHTSEYGQPASGWERRLTLPPSIISSSTGEQTCELLPSLCWGSSDRTEDTGLVTSLLWFPSFYDSFHSPR